MTMKSRSIYEIPIKTFFETVRQNITKNYYYLNMFWMPIIEERAKRYVDSYAEDYLLNSIFRWCYLNNTEKLTALEQEMKNLNDILTPSGFASYQKIVMNDIVGNSIENNVHNRILDTRAEIRGMLYYAKLNYSIALEPKQPSKKTHDFNAISTNSHIAVEAKFIRHPDKLGKYLKRWWQAQAEINGVRPLGYLPHVKFKWDEIDRDELSTQEIEKVKQFLKSVFEYPNSDNKLSFGRINISYSPTNKLEPVTTPLEEIEENPKYIQCKVDPLIRKIRDITDHALKEQLAIPIKKGMGISCYLILDLTSDIDFYHRKIFENKLTDLKNEFRLNGLNIITEEAHYL